MRIEHQHTSRTTSAGAPMVEKCDGGQVSHAFCGSVRPHGGLKRITQIYDLENTSDKRSLVTDWLPTSFLPYMSGPGIWNREGCQTV